MKREKVFYEKAGQEYDELTSGSFFRYFIQRRKVLLRSLNINITDSHIIDLGCGTGTYFDVFTESCILIGSDYSFSALKRCKSIFFNSILVNSDACFMPFKDNSVDVVILFGLIHHLYSAMELLLSEVNRTLKKGGLIVIDEPNGYNLMWYLVLASKTGRQIDGGLTKPVAPLDLKNKLVKFNFKISFEKYWGFIPPLFLKRKIFLMLNRYLEKSPLRLFAIRYTIVGKSS